MDNRTQKGKEINGRETAAANMPPNWRAINVIKLRKYYCRQYWLKPPEDLLISYPFDKSNGNENNLLRIHCRPVYGTVSGMAALQGFSQNWPLT